MYSLELIDEKNPFFSFPQGIIFLIGVLGNVLVCCVVFKSRSMHTTTNCYLVSLAIADTITLVASVPQEILSYHILGHRWVWGPVGCTLMIYLQYLGIDASGWSFWNSLYLLFLNY